ncbi:MAG: hypothetical protein U1F61_26785 [Opitutaceae bacterium]
MNLLLFSHDPVYAGAAVAAGVNAIIVDWEFRSKERRQAGFNTEINEGTASDLRAIRAATPGRIICRINNDPATRREELRLACELGADEVLLPMVRTTAEVHDCLDALPSGRELSILVETEESLALARDWDALPLARVYLGLNDLLIQRGRGHLFSPLIDGTIEQFRASYHGQLSVAGVTLPGSGHPIPCRLLMAELARLGCNFGVGRRSFRRDIPLEALRPGVFAIHEEWRKLQHRSDGQREVDQQAFVSLVRNLITHAWRPACAC